MYYPPPDPTIPAGLCQCGCGHATMIATQNNIKSRWIKGQPLPFVRGHHMRKVLNPRGTMEERFWAKVHKTENCWLWTGGHSEDGYGIFSINADTLQGAHRVSWILTHGPIPDGLWVLHNCPGGDNPACVNPGHLWLGTATDNNQDMSRKGRHFTKTRPEIVARGTAFIHRVKLNDEAVKVIRFLRGIKLQWQIAAAYHIDQTMVSKIQLRQWWTHVP